MGRRIFPVRLDSYSVYVQPTQLDSPIPDGPSKITFSVLQSILFHDGCLGRFDGDVEELLERQRQHTDGGKCLLLANRSYYD
jgi:hypothetical protein